jgi:OFA family oxalate/formate antiporter-like MFS transporter
MNSSSTAVGQIKSKRIFYLAFGTVTYLYIGLMYAWSIFAQPIGVTYPEYAPYLSQVFQLSMFINTIAALIGSQIYKRKSPRVTMLLASILFGVGFSATALCASWGIWALFLFYSVFVGAGIGMAYNTIISLVNSWFPDKTGLSSGVMLMGVGLSPLLLGSLANAAFEIVDWQAVFVVLAITGVIFLLALVLIIPLAPTDIARQLGMKEAAATSEAGPAKSHNPLRTKSFWIFCAWSTPSIACGLVLIGSASQGATFLGIDVGFAALLVGLMGVMNAIGRFATGMLTDRFGVRFTMFLSGVLVIIAMVCMTLAFSMGGSEFSRVLYIIAAIVAGYPYGSAPVINAAYAKHRQTAANYAFSLSLLNCNMTLAAALNMLLLSIFGAPNTGSGATIYSVLIVLAVIAFIAMLAFRRVHKRDLEKLAEEVQEAQ